MNNNLRFTRKRLSQVIAAAVFTSVSAGAFAGDFSLIHNNITLIGGSGGSVGVEADGIASPAMIPTSVGGLPDLSFGLKAADAEAGEYYVRLRMSINSQTKSNSLNLSSLGTVKVTIDGSGNLTGATMVTEGQDYYQDIAVSGTKQSGSSTFSVSGNFAAKTTMLSFSAGSITLEVNDILAHLSGRELFDDIIGGFNYDDHYTYSIHLQPVAGPTALVFGHDGGATFTAFPRQNCSAFTVQGTLTIGAPSGAATQPTPIVENCSSGEDPDDEEDPIVDDEVLQELEDNKQAIEDAINNQNITLEIENLATDSTNKATEQTQKIVDAVTGDSSTVDPLTLLQAVDTITGTAATGTKVAASDSSSENTQTALVQNSIAITTGAATVLNALADQGATLNGTQVEQVNSIVSNTLDTLNNIADTTASTPAQLTELVKQANEITQARAALGIPPTSQEADQVAELSRELGAAVVSKVLGQNVSQDKIGELLDANPALLDDIVAASLTLLPFGTESQAELDQRIKDAYKARFGTEVVNMKTSFARSYPLTQGEINGLIRSMKAEIQGVGDIVFFRQTSTLMDDSHSRQMLAATTSEDMTADPVTGDLRLQMPGEAYSALLLGIKTVPESIPSGLNFLADGRVIFIREGFAVEMAPVSVDRLGFIAATVESGYTPAFNDNNGSFELDLGGNQLFSGAFAYDNLNGKDLENCGDLSFTEPTGALNSAGYAFVATCSASGVSQRIQPYPYSADFLSSLSAHGLSGRIDRNTGFVTVAGIGTFKLGFFVTAPSAAEASYLAANGDAFGLAYQGGDFNGDGRLDYKIISASGVQLLLGTN
jgi:hypothetical protein